ncbi:unnamed protein product [Eruca vesicaria subsp. sativa]|uniref:Uncharacterized protein n=1 Tax=Eruca vesicaria subsp. sativa TaxID=29727 RepID=A0ABC8LNV5_ERUVS|nr:unnamed protein product [Eruca vesicaria subsp. sativa]
MPDSNYLNWRWKPDGCAIPRMKLTLILLMKRGGQIIYALNLRHHSHSLRLLNRFQRSRPDTILQRECLTSLLLNGVTNECGLCSNCWNLHVLFLVSGISSSVYSDKYRYVANNDMVEMVLLVNTIFLDVVLYNHISSRRQRFDSAYCWCWRHEP